MKNFQATEEVSRLPREHPAIQKNKFHNFFIFCGWIWLPRSGPDTLRWYDLLALVWFWFAILKFFFVFVQKTVKGL